MLKLELSECPENELIRDKILLDTGYFERMIIEI